MFKFVVLAVVITYVNAGNLLRGGFVGGSGGGFIGGLAFSRGHVGPLLAPTLSTVPIGPVIAAVQSTRTYEVRPLDLPSEPPVPQLIEVLPNEQPVQFVFRSASSPVLVQQLHAPGAPGQYEETRSEEEPYRLSHEVYKPVIQEVREVIQPFRTVVQEVKPVLEEVHTIVAKGEPKLHAGIGPLPVAAPVQPAPFPFATPVLRSAPAQFAAPVLRSVPGQFATPVLRSAPAQFAAPVLSSAQGQFAGPVLSSAQGQFAGPFLRSASAQFAAPVHSSAPAQFAAPVFKPVPTLAAKAAKAAH
jgi:hypothetical protein